MLLRFRQDIAYPAYKRCRIKLCAKNLIRTIGEDCDPPVADKSHFLLWLCSFNPGTEIFSVSYTRFALNVHQYQVVVLTPEHLQSPIGTQGGIDLKSRDAKDLIA